MNDRQRRWWRITIAPHVRVPAEWTRWLGRFPSSFRHLVTACRLRPFHGRFVTVVFWIGSFSSCGWFPRGEPIQFTVPLEIEGQPVGSAIIDTGGGYDVLLAEPYGLRLVDRVELIVLGGRERVDVTEPFSYRVGILEGVSVGAIVGASICRCNGLGFQFLRKHGGVLSLDFERGQAAWVESAEEVGILREFAPPPPHLADFDTMFLPVTVGSGLRRVSTIALIDTGSATTLIQRRLLDPEIARAAVEPIVSLREDRLGGVSVAVTLFDNTSLPDVIIGTNVMDAWGTRWYVEFNSRGGGVMNVVPPVDRTGDDADVGGLSAAVPRSVLDINGRGTSNEISR